MLEGSLYVLLTQWVLERDMTHWNLTLALCKERELYKDQSVAARYLWTPSTCSRGHTCTLAFDLFAFSVSPSTTLSRQTSPLLFFSKECTLEHPHRLVNIHPVHLTRMAALFLSNQSEGPPEKKTASPSERQHLCLSLLLWCLRDSGVIPGTEIPRNRALWSVPVSMVPLRQREVLSGPGVFVKSPWKDGSVSWDPGPTVGRIPLWLRLSWGCAAQRMEGKAGGGKTQKQHVWVLARRHASLRGSGGLGHSGGK